MTTKRAKKKAVKPSPRKVAAALRPSNALTRTGDFAALVQRVVAIIEGARARVLRTVNSEMVLSYWHIGREIVEYVQRGEARAEYGEQVIEDLSRQLKERVGRGYSSTNLRYFRLFYQQYKNRKPELRVGPGEPREFITSVVMNVPGAVGGQFATSLVTNSKRGAEADDALRGFSSRLSWSHYRTLPMKVHEPSTRSRPSSCELATTRSPWPSAEARLLGRDL